MQRMFPKITLLILSVFITFGCQSEENMLMNIDPLPSDTSTYNVTYLALGDSYTIGEGVPEKERYPVQLKDSLEFAGVFIDKLQIIARTGWTTDELWTAMDGAKLDRSYDLVSLLIGVNNQFRGRTPESYRPEFKKLLNRAISLAGNDPTRVIVLSIPDWGVTPFAQGRDRDQIASEIDVYNAINQQESADAGVTWIDVTYVSRLAAEQPELLASDKLHPSGKMYRYWMEDMFNDAREILTR